MTRSNGHDDDFWRDLRLELIPDELSPEEAARRMDEATDEPLPAEKIDEIVRDVLSRQAAEAEGDGGNPVEVTDPEPAWPRFRLLQGVPVLGRLSRVAAAVLLGVSLATAGVVVAVVLLWPERRDPLRTLRYDHATLIVVDGSTDYRLRMSAAVKIYMWVRGGVMRLLTVEVSDGASAEAARVAIETIKAQLGNADPVPESGHVVDLEPLVSTMTNAELSDSDRVWAIRELTIELVAGIASLQVASRDEQAIELGRECSECLRRLSRLASRPR